MKTTRKNPNSTPQRSSNPTTVKSTTNQDH